MKKVTKALATAAAFLLTVSCGGKAAVAQPERGSSGGGAAMHLKEDRGEILVKFKTGMTGEAAGRFAAREGLTMVRLVSEPALYLFRLPAGASLKEAIERLSACGEVEYAEPNYERR